MRRTTLHANKPQWAAATVAAVRPAKDITTPLCLGINLPPRLNRSVSRIKSSSRHEVTIPNLVFRCSEFGGVTIAASSSVPWIYMAQFWHTLKEDGSKYQLRFMLDKKELHFFTLYDFSDKSFHLPQATANNHKCTSCTPPSFSDMDPITTSNSTTSGNQEQDEDFDFGPDSYASDDEEIPEASNTRHYGETIIFNDDDNKERTSRWVNKSVKKFNPYARYGVEHWKNPHAKIFYIRKQKEPGKPKEEIYSNSKIVQVIKTILTRTIVRTIYLLIMKSQDTGLCNTELLWSLSVFIRSSVIWKECMTSNLELKSYQQKLAHWHHEYLS
ncbi:hypothetical protein Tco_1066586 [Tanacetum coccineum]|uniref:Uncharacterized protein n=1 Tax=Tanacetum coccineum TaxID=301880 RepID=A0ABQ5HBQ4_9ASTR